MLWACGKAAYHDRSTWLSKTAYFMVARKRKRKKKEETRV
jgi:hypothetical protein